MEPTHPQSPVAPVIPTEPVHSPTPSQSPPASIPIPKPAHARALLIAGVLVIITVVAIGTMLLMSFYQKTTLKNAEIAHPTLDRIKHAGRIVVGTDATYPPMEYLDEHKNYIGYDIDLANRIGEKLGVKVVYKTVVFDNIFKELEDKKIDIIISSVSITDERRAKYDFSSSYLNAGQVILTRRDNTTIKSTADLKGRRIAVQKGTTNETQAHGFTTSDNVIVFDDTVKATEALVDGHADAIFSDLTGAKGIVNSHPQLKITGDPFTTEEYGIVLRRDEDDLLTEINNSLNSLRQQGVLVLLKQKWLE